MGLHVWGASEECKNAIVQGMRALRELSGWCDRFTYEQVFIAANSVLKHRLPSREAPEFVYSLTELKSEGRVRMGFSNKIDRTGTRVDVYQLVR